jgi:DNA-binding HxlR family transcriptional regulator
MPPTKSTTTDPPSKATGRFAYEGLERLIHEKARLSILASLAAHPDGLLFNELKSLCSLTDGNLSRQIQLLQESGFIEVWKGFRNKRPQTLCRLSQTGRSRFLEYIEQLQTVVTDAGAANKISSRHSNPVPRTFLPAT